MSVFTAVQHAQSIVAGRAHRTLSMHGLLLELGVTVAVRHHPPVQAAAGAVSGPSQHQS